MKFAFVAVCACAVLIVGASAANADTIIDFGPLSGNNGDSYTGHVEDGFTISSTDGDWFEAHVFGNPTPDIFAGPIGSVGTSEITVTDTSGDLFGFASVDLSSNSNSGSTYAIEGFRNGSSVFTQNGTIGNINTFNTIVSTNSNVFFDTLVIAMTPVSGVTSMNMDNITLSPVPEPTSLALFGLGTLGLAAHRRRKRRATT